MLPKFLRSILMKNSRSLTATLLDLGRAMPYTLNVPVAESCWRACDVKYPKTSGHDALAKGLMSHSCHLHKEIHTSYTHSMKVHRYFFSSQAISAMQLSFSTVQCSAVHQPPFPQRLCLMQTSSRPLLLTTPPA